MLDVPQVRWPRPPSSLYPAPAPAPATAAASPAPAAASPPPTVTPDKQSASAKKVAASLSLCAAGLQPPVGCAWMRTLHIPCTLMLTRFQSEQHTQYRVLTHPHPVALHPQALTNHPHALLSQLRHPNSVGRCPTMVHGPVLGITKGAPCTLDPGLFAWVADRPKLGRALP